MLSRELRSGSFAAGRIAVRVPAQHPAVEAFAEVARDRKCAELAKEGREHDGHDDEAREPADDEAERIEPDQEEGPSDGDEARGPERLKPSLPPIEGLPGNPKMPARARHIARPLTRLL